MALNSYLLIITLNINGHNAPIKRHRVSVWIQSTISQAEKDNYYMVSLICET